MTHPRHQNHTKLGHSNVCNIMTRWVALMWPPIICQWPWLHMPDKQFETWYKIATAFNDKIGIWSHFEMPKREFSADISYRTKQIIKTDHSVIGRSQGVCLSNISKETTVLRKGLIPPDQNSEEAEEFGNRFGS